MSKDSPRPGRIELPTHWVGFTPGFDGEVANLAKHMLGLPPEVLRTHALVIGATGSGKTNLLHQLIAQDIKLGHSFIVLNARGDLTDSVVELCEGHVDPELLKIVDLREKVKPFGFNPLSGPGEPYFRALQVLQVIATESASFGVQLSETLRNALLLFAELGVPLTSLERLFYDSRFRTGLLARATSVPVTAFWERFDALSLERQNAFAMPVLNKVSLILGPSVLRRILGHPRPVDLAAHLNTKGSILLASLAAEELSGAATMMGTLLLSSIVREIFARVETAESARNPVRLYVDEFQNFGSADFETILAEGRRFGLSVVLSHQTLAQLSPKMRSLTLNNVGVKVVFRTGYEDSAILSRDLTGDARALSIADLQVGEAIVWQRGKGSQMIEVNEPLLSGIGALTPEAQAFKAAVYEQTEAWEEPEIERPGPNPSSKPKKWHKPNDGPSSTGDWLCD